MRHGSRPVLVAAALIGAPLALSAQGSAGTEVRIDVTGLRNTKGVVRACMTSHPDRFPRCRGDANAYSAVVSASGPVLTLDFGHVAPGKYAIALLHDENNNGKADRALSLMPKEGYGFSRDAPVKMGPPSFRDAAFDVGNAPIRQSIKMRYML